MKKHFLFICFVLFTFLLQSQNDSVFQIDSIGLLNGNNYKGIGLQLSNYWKYQKGDDKQWASPDFNDSNWQYTSPALDFSTLPENTFSTIGWFRIHINVDTALIDKTLALMVTQSGASEIYLDGKLIHSFGDIDTKDFKNEKRIDPQEIPVDILFSKKRKHLLAVRYANANAFSNYKNKISNNAGFYIKIGNFDQSIFTNHQNSNRQTAIFIFYFTFFLALSFLHLMLFLFYRKNKSNLYYSIFAGTFGTVFLYITLQKDSLYPDFTTTVTNLFPFLPDLYTPALFAMLYSIFYKKFPKVFWIWVLIFSMDFIFNFFHIEIKYLNIILNIILVIESLRIIISAITKKKEGSWIIGTGVIVTLVFFILFFVLTASGNANFYAEGWVGIIIDILAIYATLSIPISMSIYLARDFAQTNKTLSKKLIEVETLSAKTIEQEKEKQKILETQKEILEIQVQERTSEIVKQKTIIEEKNKDITDSINYAKTIQEVILPSRELKQQLFPDSFVLFKPKDIVSGDFYWYTHKNGKKIIAACDCTGHGVPGALMSMIGNNILNQIVNEHGITKPNEILDSIHNEIHKALKQEEQTENKDGMDIALITFNSETEIEFAGAQRPLWIIKNHDNASLIEIKGDKYAIGGLQTENDRKFTGHHIALTKGDCIYIFSDGFADQFSNDNRKLMTSKFKELILSIQQKSMHEQELFLNGFIDDWKGTREQIDDILVIGVRI